MNSKSEYTRVHLDESFPDDRHVNAPISIEWMMLAHGNVMKQFYSFFVYVCVRASMSKL